MAKVELYTNRGCGACVNAKRLLDSKKLTMKKRNSAHRAVLIRNSISVPMEVKRFHKFSLIMNGLVALKNYRSMSMQMN